MIKVYTGGTFDLFHYGHLNILLECKKLGHLTVGINTDEVVESRKDMKPIMSFTDRCAIVKELRCVDEVIAQEKDWDIRQLKLKNINIVVLGDDWLNKPRPEEFNAALEALKIEMKFIPYTKRLSTSEIKKYIINNSYDILCNLIKKETFNEAFNIDAI